MRVIIIPVDNNTTGKAADAELHFDQDEPLAGLKLIGFAVWERRDGKVSVTFPARQYKVNGEGRSFALLRPTDYTTGRGLVAKAQERIADAIIEAYRARVAAAKETR